ncbi:MAG: phosphoadenylyl-sulfate reductase [Methyloligella sp. ZOD6]
MALVDLSNGALLNRNDTPDVTLDTDADDAALASAAQDSRLVAINFATFADGRGMTLGRLLRERMGFKGELRAVGYLLPDQAQFLYRCGFDTAEIEDSKNLDSWKGALDRIRHNYQASSRNPFALRHGYASEESSGNGVDGSSGPERARQLDQRLAAAESLEDRIEIVARAVEGRIAFSSSLGIEDQAILDAIARADKGEAEFDIFTLQTGRLFRETEETLVRSEERYGLPIRAVAPDPKEVLELVSQDGIFGFRQSIENRKRCCEIRKVHPLNKALAGAGAWITGIRREQSGNRSNMPFAEWDEGHGLIKINPLADWSADKLDAYVAEHDVPVNPLHAQGFPSIGCQPCTRAVQPGEDPRAGRWWWENEDKKECGLHMSPIRQAQFEDQKETQPA